MSRWHRLTPKTAPDSHSLFSLFSLSPVSPVQNQALCFAADWWRMETSTTITDLDADSLAECGRYLDLQDLSNMAMSCKFLKTVAYSDSIWQRWFRSHSFLSYPCFYQISHHKYAKCGFSGIWVMRYMMGLCGFVDCMFWI